MCAIIGAILQDISSPSKLALANSILAHIWKESHERGRDGRGYSMMSSSTLRNKVSRSTTRQKVSAPPKVVSYCQFLTLVANMRAEPTTEYVQQKSTLDQQPYICGAWSVVHNGTVANDAELRNGRLTTTIDSAAIAEQLANVGLGFEEFCRVIRKIKGSYAILATNEDAFARFYVAANYRPVWYIKTELGFFFASARHYFPEEYVPVMVQPYTALLFTPRGVQASASLYPEQELEGRRRALVVCSGGLDSVVSAAYAQKRLGMDIHLLHFKYGSRAEGPEVDAVLRVGEFLECPVTVFPLPVYSKSDSPLLDPDSAVAGGEAGAEFAHEWVPARNLLLLSVATAFAEARGIETIVLGNNLEEAGAYPDNEPEFIARFNDLLPFAVGDGKRMRVIMPVGNLMKHEIVKLGHDVGAPMHLTWSCYRAGEHHCGTCGPCYMRRKAFQINNLPEVITYKDEQ